MGNKAPQPTAEERDVIYSQGSQRAWLTMLGECIRKLATAEERDVIYSQGSQRAWLTMLGECIRKLGTDGDAERWRLERQEVILTLRDLCERFGDNDWPDELHLADVIRKHLGNYLE